MNEKITECFKLPEIFCELRKNQKNREYFKIKKLLKRSVLDTIEIRSLDIIKKLPNILKKWSDLKKNNGFKKIELKYKIKAGVRQFQAEIKSICKKDRSFNKMLISQLKFKMYFYEAVIDTE